MYIKQYYVDIMKDKLSASKKNKKIVKLLALYFTVFTNFLEFTLRFEVIEI